jgi:hypothetical protein
MPSPRVWSRDDFVAFSDRLYPRGRYHGATKIEDAVDEVNDLMALAEAALVNPPATPDSLSAIVRKATSAPRVWSRADFLEALRLSGVSDGSVAQDWAVKACRILETIEREVSHSASPLPTVRDERGRFLPKPQLHSDSPIVIEARAG